MFIEQSLCISFHVHALSVPKLLLYVLKDFLICLVHEMLQLVDGAVDLFSSIFKEDGLLIDMEVPEKPRTLDVYIQGWHN